jgi:cyclophilin family peptidyl-prolyl cis-trans isomerase
MLTRTHIIALVCILAFGGLYMYSRSQRGVQPVDNTNAIPVLINDNNVVATTSANTQNQQPIKSTMKPTAPVRPEKLLPNGTHTVTIETTLGTIVIETYDNDAPLATANFVALAKAGFYDNVIFHRVIPGFMIQGGDPTGTGRGGPGYRFADELSPATESYKNGYKRGTVAMANAGSNTNGSQFFIMHADYPLDHKYTIFGRVIKGIEVVDAIAALQTDYEDRPNTPPAMKKVTVVAK